MNPLYEEERVPEDETKLEESDGGEFIRVRKSVWSELHRAYLHSAEWGAIREKVFERDAHLCQGCRVAPAAVVHHLTYDHWRQELLFELISLCPLCHARVHNRELAPDPEFGIVALADRMTNMCLRILLYLRSTPGATTPMITTFVPGDWTLRTSALDCLVYWKLATRNGATWFLAPRTPDQRRTCALLLRDLDQRALGTPGNRWARASGDDEQEAGITLTRVGLVTSRPFTDNKDLVLELTGVDRTPFKGWLY